MTLNSPEDSPEQMPDGHYKVDRRYRESKYFLNDQLRYADSVQDFRSVREAVLRSSQFNLGKVAFQFVPIDDTGPK